MSPPGLQLDTNVPQDGPNQLPSHEDAPSPSSPSRVPVNFFDPVGVRELKRTMTTRSTRSQSQAHHRGNAPPPTLHSSEKTDSLSSSSVTGGLGVDDSFDFEQTLNDLIRR